MNGLKRRYQALYRDGNKFIIRISDKLNDTNYYYIKCNVLFVMILWTETIKYGNKLLEEENWGIFLMALSLSVVAIHFISKTQIL